MKGVYAHAKLHKKKEKGGLFHLRSLLYTLQFQKLLYLRSTALMRRGGRAGWKSPQRRAGASVCVELKVPPEVPAQ